MARRDLYSECNVVGAPLDAFTEECCKHCINPECTRSAFGKTKFDQRVSTWHDRLFANIPRMDPGDPRFGKIAAQKFVLFNEPLTVSSAWVDPRDLSDQVAAPVIPIEPAPIEPTPALVVAKPAEPSVVEGPTPAPAGRLAQHLVLANTPVQRGQMLQPPVGTPKPAVAWDAPVPTADTQGVQVVKSGARVKLGSV